MNDQQAKGTLAKAKGSIEAFLGRISGNRMREATGVAHKVEGDIRRGVGDVQEAVERPVTPDRTAP